MNNLAFFISRTPARQKRLPNPLSRHSRARPHDLMRPEKPACAPNRFNSLIIPNLHPLRKTGNGRKKPVTDFGYGSTFTGISDTGSVTFFVSVLTFPP